MFDLSLEIFKYLGTLRSIRLSNKEIRLTCIYHVLQPPYAILYPYAAALYHPKCYPWFDE